MTETKQAEVKLKIKLNNAASQHAQPGEQKAQIGEHKSTSHVRGNLIVKDQLIGVGDGNNKIFKCIEGKGNKVKTITHLVKGSVTIIVGGKPATPEIHYNKGEIIFSEAPAIGEQIMANFEYIIPVKHDFLTTANNARKELVNAGGQEYSTAKGPYEKNFSPSPIGGGIGAPEKSIKQGEQQTK